MSKLISANILRLKQNKLFWFFMIFMAALASFLAVIQYIEHVAHGVVVTLNNVFFGYGLFIGILMAVFSSLYLGTEYSDGTIRNKLMIGHTRTEIYLANLITNIGVSVLLCLVFVLFATIIGTPLIGFVTLDTPMLLLLLFGTFLLAIAYASIFTLISMICSNKAAVAVISILLVVGFLLLASYIIQRLHAPEFYEAIFYEKTSAFSSLVVSGENDEQIPNPTYLRGTARIVYQFIYDFLPTGQSIQYLSLDILHPWQLPLYSVLITIATTISGIAIFQKKDIK